ncbi:MAG: winged helix DNA-binding domain-containing protein [Arachnia sp.]
MSDIERRARVAMRQALHPDAQVIGSVGAARAVVALHATEPASVYLSAWARARAPREDVETAIAERRLVRQLSMRRTVFAVPADLLPALYASVCPRIAQRERKALVKAAALAGVPGRPEDWAERAVDAVVAELDHSEPLTAREIRERVPEVDGSYQQGAGTKWASTVQLAPKVLPIAALEGRIVRCTEGGDWRTSTPRWTATSRWLGAMERLGEREGYAEAVRRWLATHGPGTVDDAAWWLGATKAAVRTALTDLEAIPVSLDGGQVGWLLPDDVEPVASPERWVALLPLLDPTIMGWRDRTFLLGPHRPRLFDSVGNAGTTALVDGRVVGVWVQDDTQRVRVRLLESIDDGARRALEAEAAHLTEWLGGQRVFSVYPSAAMRGD